MSCERMIDPLRVSLRMRSSTTDRSRVASSRAGPRPRARWCSRIRRGPSVSGSGERLPYGRTEQRRRMAEGRVDLVLRPVELRTHEIVGFLGEIGVIPAVAADLVPLGGGALENFRVRLDHFAQHEERDVHVARLEDVEQLRRELGTGAVVEGHGDVLTVDVDIGSTRISAAAAVAGLAASLRRVGRRRLRQAPAR